MYPAAGIAYETIRSDPAAAVEAVRTPIDQVHHPAGKQAIPRVSGRAPPVVPDG